MTIRIYLFSALLGFFIRPCPLCRFDFSLCLGPIQQRSFPKLRSASNQWMDGWMDEYGYELAWWRCQGRICMDGWMVRSSLGHLCVHIEEEKKVEKWQEWHELVLFSEMGGVGLDWL
jgi:hypothetical protein